MMHNNATDATENIEVIDVMEAADATAATATIEAAVAVTATESHEAAEATAAAGATVDAAPVHDHLSEEGLARIRAEQEAMRRRADRHNKGLVMVHTGNGKGKTTAALGLLLRAWGRDMRVAMLQFIKAKTGNWGEIRAAQKLGIEIVPLGDGFTWTSDDLAKDRALAQEGWQLCRAKIESGEYDIVILDEMTYCFHYGWLDLDEVIETLRRRPEGQHVVITGREAPERLIEFADLVTEMREIKHPYQAGVKAQKGIEF
jgi:cob(I)alamin adenosyltransferase